MMAEEPQSTDHVAPPTTTAGPVPTGGAEQRQDLNDLYRDFHPWLISYARMLDPDRADDHVQEAFAALTVRTRRPPPVVNQRGYLVRIVQRRSRRPVNRLRPLLPAFATTRYYDRYQDPDLARAVATLPEQQRTCVALFYGNDTSIPRIAELLDLHPSTVKTHLSRALATLRRELEER